jgi:hypothetical protein
MRTTSLLLSAVFLGGLACHDSTAPERTLRAIDQIVVPASAAAGDSIHIKFRASTAQCDNDVMVSSTMDEASMRFTVTGVTGGSCSPGYPPGVYISPVYEYFVVPPHPVPFTINFAEPGQADSVRVVISP